MKRSLGIALMLLLASVITKGQGINSLPADQETDIKDICLVATHTQFAMDVNTAEQDLQSIYNKLNFSGYNIEVISCDRLKNSALAYWDQTENRSYILINPNKLTNLNDRYYSHAFVIAHEFSHIAKKHFSLQAIPSNSNKRQLELAADEYAASIIKKMGGTEEDCIYALSSLNNPLDDTYSDHPTLEKRIAAVHRGFADDIVLSSNHSYYVDIFSSISNASLLKYPNGINQYDISYYSQKNKMMPYSIVNLNGVYWIYWQKDSEANLYYMYWNYDTYPGDDIQKFFDKGYNIKYAEQINNKWFIVMLKYPTSWAQKTRAINKATFHDDIKPYLDDGFSIQNITDWSSTQYWVLLTKDATTHYSWAIKPTYDDFKTWYTQQTNDGYNYMYCFKHVQNGYFGFMSTKAGVTNWSIRSLTDSNKDDLINFMNSGYRIENITCDDYIKFTFAKY